MPNEGPVMAKMLCEVFQQANKVLWPREHLETLDRYVGVNEYWQHEANRLNAVLAPLIEAECAAALEMREVCAKFVEENTPYQQGIGSVGIPMANHIRTLSIPGEFALRELLQLALDSGFMDGTGGNAAVLTKTPDSIIAAWLKARTK